MIVTSEERIQEIERLATELEFLLSQHDGVLDYEGLHDFARELSAWAQSYQQGLRYGLLHEDTDALENRHGWIAGVNDRLQLETEDCHSDYGTVASDAMDFIRGARQVRLIAAVSRCPAKRYDADFRLSA